MTKHAARTAGEAKAMPQEKLKRFSLYLEEGQWQALAEVARDLQKSYGHRWSRGAVVRLALSQFLSEHRKIV